MVCITSPALTVVMSRAWGTHNVWRHMGQCSQSCVGWCTKERSCMLDVIVRERPGRSVGEA
jgi:hypothetical protein